MHMHLSLTIVWHFVFTPIFSSCAILMTFLFSYHVIKMEREVPILMCTLYVCVFTVSFVPQSNFTRLFGLYRASFRIWAKGGQSSIMYMYWWGKRHTVVLSTGGIMVAYM